MVDIKPTIETSSITQDGKKGWKATKTVGDKKTEYIIWDKNNNGVLDASDTKENGEFSDAGDFTIEEKKQMTESIFKLQGSKCSVGDWFNSDYQNNKQPQSQQQTQQPAKKKGFWGSVGQVFSVIGNGVSGFLGMMLGFGGGGNSWAFNGGSGNDWAVRSQSGYTGLMNNMSAGMTANYNMFGNQGMGSSMGGGYENALGQILEMNNQQNEQRMQEFNEYQETAKAENEKKKAEQDKVNNQKLVENTYKDVAKDDDNQKYNKINAKKVDELYSVDEENYTEEQINTIKTIKDCPQIPFDAIAKDDEKGKLSTKMAKRLNETISKYLNANESDQQDMMTKAEFTKLQGYLKNAQNGKLSESDIKAINDIIKKAMKID